MNGLFTLLTTALAFMALGLLVLLMGGGSFADGPVDIAPIVAEQGRVQAASLPEVPGGGSETCTDDLDATGADPEREVLDKAGDSAPRSGEKDKPLDAGIISGLNLPEGMGLKIAGTGEYCTQ